MSVTGGARIAPVPPAARSGRGGAPIDVVACDYGGVLTNPIAETFAAFERSTGIGAVQIGTAIATVAAAEGRNPMAELEKGRTTERAFLEKVTAAMDAPPEALARMADFRHVWFAGRRPNHVFIDYLGALRRRGVRLALLTNNVREWEPLWRATVPTDDLFELVVNSAHEGTRKPEPAIYERLLARLEVPAERCLFIDDVEENCAAAEASGMPAIRFGSTDQVMRAIDAALGRGARPPEETSA